MVEESGEEDTPEIESPETVPSVWRTINDPVIVFPDKETAKTYLENVSKPRSVTRVEYSPEGTATEAEFGKTIRNEEYRKKKLEEHKKNLRSAAGLMAAHSSVQPEDVPFPEDENDDGESHEPPTDAIERITEEIVNRIP